MASSTDPGVTVNATASRARAVPGRKARYLSWALQLVAAVAFLAAGGAKLAGAPMMVGIFEQIGFGQWFRLVTGLVEVAGGIAILFPATAAHGGLLLATTMVFGALTHLFLIGGSAIPAIVLLLVTATVAWLNRARLLRNASAPA